jgi:hypothetical protein
LNPRLPPCEICVGRLPMELRAVENRESTWKTPGQWPSTGESAVMLLHSLRAGSPVVTNTGCCPSAAPTTPTPDLRDHNLNRLPASSQLREPEGW